MKKTLIYLLLLIQSVVAFGQSSTPINTSKIAVSTSGKYATLFRYKIKRKNGDTLSNYAWVNTDINGVIVNPRARRLNNLFASSITALANVPPTYSLSSTPAIDDFLNEKHIGYMVNYQFKDINTTKTSYDEFIQSGATQICVNVRWDDVFQTYAQQVSNNSSSWARHDDLINYAKNKGVKVSLRICADRDDGPINNLFGGPGDFYLLSNSAKDEWGYEVGVSAGSGHSSLAYATGRAMMLDFVEKTVTRYNGILGNKFLWYSVGFTGQEEAGYNFMNQRFSPGGGREPGHPALYDYSTHAVTGFRNWLTTKYTTIEALKTAWGSSDESFSAIEPPKTNLPFGTATHFDIAAIFTTAKGKDWWAYHYSLIKDFAISARAFSSGMGVKFYAEFGSVSDFASNARLSSNVKDLDTWTDGIKAQFGAYPSQDQLAISLDIMRSNYGKKLSTEAHIIDFTGEGTSIFGANPPEKVREIATYWLKKGVESQLKEIVFIADRNDVANYNVMRGVATELKNYLFNYNQTTPTIATVNYSLNEMLNSYYDVFNRWRLAGGGTNARVNMVQSTTIGGGGSGGGTIPNLLQLYDIAYFNFSDANTKSSQYQTSYANNRVMVQCATHSITYTSGTKSKASYVVKSVDGKEWVKMTQTQGVNNSENNEAYRNNHPDRRYIPNIVEDAVFYLPIQDYDIVITNTGTTSFEFEMSQPHQPNPNGFSTFKRILTAGETYTYRVYASRMNTQPDYERAIKINCNKYE